MQRIGPARPHRALRAAAALAAAAAALSLTACQGEGLRPSGSATGAAAATVSDGGGAPAPRRPAGDACTVRELRITAGVPPRRPGRLVLRAVNTGRRACVLYGYPLLHLTPAQRAVTPADRGAPSGPDPRLRPGAAARAVVRTADARREHAPEKRTVTGFRLTLQNARGGPLGPPVLLPAPAGRLTVETGAAAAGYWTCPRRH